MFEPYLYNPAYGGMTNSLTLTAVARKQWSGFPGAPTSQFIAAHLPIYRLSSGAGIRIDNQSLGAHHQINGQVSYNYIFTGLANGIISAGLGIGILNSFLDGNILRAPDGNYENTINHNDPNLSAQKESYTAASLTGGILYRNNSMEVGFSILQGINTTLSDRYTYTPVRHLMFNAAYFIKFSNELRLAPSVLLKYDFRILQTDTDLQLYFKNFIFGGGIRGYSGHSFDSFKLSLSGRVMENLMAGYVYEGSLSQLKSYNDNTHEIFLQYRLPIKLLNQRENVIYHPRM